MVWTQRTTVNPTYTPAYWTSSSVNTNPATRAAITDWYFRQTIDGITYDIWPIDFTWVLSVAVVALVIQAAVRAETWGTETCVYTGGLFKITSTNTTVYTQVSTISYPSLWSNIVTMMWWPWTATAWAGTSGIWGSRSKPSTTFTQRDPIAVYLSLLQTAGGDQIQTAGGDNIYCNNAEEDYAGTDWTQRIIP